MPNLDDFYSFKSTGSGGGSGGRGNGFGCGGWTVIVIVIVMLIFFIANGADWDAIESLLTLGLLAFFFIRWLFR